MRRKARRENRGGKRLYTAQGGSHEGDEKSQHDKRPKLGEMRDRKRRCENPSDDARRIGRLQLGSADLRYGTAARSVPRKLGLNGEERGKKAQSHAQTNESPTSDVAQRRAHK